FSGNCVGCGEKGFRYFTEFCNHINLKLTTQPKKQKHLQYYLYRNAQGVLVKGPAICWRGGDSRSRQSTSNPSVGHMTSEPPLLAELTSTADTSTPMNAPTAPLTNGRHHPVSQHPSHQPAQTVQGPGTMTNSGPPKKRHKSWSSESAATTETPSKTTAPTPANDTKTAEYGTQMYVTQGSLQETVLSVTVPDHLLQTCKLQPVILKGHGTLPPLYGNVSDVKVSSQLKDCYRSCHALPRLYEHYRATPIQPLSTEMQVLLTVYYLVQLGPDQIPLMDDLEQIFIRSWRESHLCQQPHTQPVAPPPGPAQPVSATQLPWLAKLATSSSGDAVLSAKEISQELAAGMEGELGALLHSLDGDVDSLLETIKVEKNVSLPPPRGLEPSHGTDNATCTEFEADWHQIRPVQLAVARKLLSHVCAIADSSTQNLDLGSFHKVEFLIFTPPSEAAFQQTVLHLWKSGVLRELCLEKECLSQKEAEQYVVKLDPDAQDKINQFIQNSKKNPYTLFILVHDHAHWDINRSGKMFRGGDPESGIVDSLLNCPDVWDAPNILTLHVTSFPYALQTQCTRISPYNEIHWPSANNIDMDLYHEKTKYFGVSEFLESAQSGNGQSLLRYDSAFENMAATLGESTVIVLYTHWSRNVAWQGLALLLV
ncbi:hypothetical protein JZ751_010474, partial [Albula glossodonta]